MSYQNIHNAITTCITDYITHLDDETEVVGLYALIMREAERALIKEALRCNCNNQTRAAKWLGITRNTLRKKITELGLDTLS